MAFISSQKIFPHLIHPGFQQTIFLKLWAENKKEKQGQVTLEADKLLHEDAMPKYEEGSMAENT
jgi:hypothetical protein